MPKNVAPRGSRRNKLYYSYNVDVCLYYSHDKYFKWTNIYDFTLHCRNAEFYFRKVSESLKGQWEDRIPYLYTIYRSMFSFFLSTIFILRELEFKNCYIVLCSLVIPNWDTFFGLLRKQKLYLLAVWIRKPFLTSSVESSFRVWIKGRGQRAILGFH